MASIRPRLIAVENVGFLFRLNVGIMGFNSATADRRGELGKYLPNKHIPHVASIRPRLIAVENIHCGRGCERV